MTPQLDQHDLERMLTDADQAVSDLKPDNALSNLLCYYQARTKGSVEPCVRGDAFAKSIGQRLENLLYEVCHGRR